MFELRVCWENWKSVLVDRARPGGFWRHSELGRIERQICRLPILSAGCGNIWGIGVAFDLMGDEQSAINCIVCENAILRVIKCDFIQKDCSYVRPTAVKDEEI